MSDTTSPHNDCTSEKNVIEVRYEKKDNPGMVSSIVGCIMAVLGILTLGVVFCPIALVCAIIGLINATSAEESNSLGINMLAWILTIIGFVTSPVLLGIIGLSAL